MIIDKSFVRIGADWTTEQALDVLDRVNVRRAIVHAAAGGDVRYYDCDIDDIRRRLRAADLAENTSRLVADAVQVWGRETATVRTVPARVDARTLLLDGEQLVGLLLPSERDPSRSADPIGAEPRALTASAPPRLGVGQKAPLLVKITKDLSVSGTLPLSLAKGDRIEVLVVPSRGLRVVGAPNGMLLVGDEPETPPLRFELEGLNVEEGETRVYAFKDGQGVGILRVAIAVVQGPAAADVQAEVVETTNRMQQVSPSPDLSLIVQEDHAARSYNILLNALDTSLGLNYRPFGPIRLQVDPERFFAELFADIEAIVTSSASPREKMELLGAKGTHLLDQVVPVPMRELLWRLRGRIRTVQIQSEEPWIPWELCKLYGDDGTGSIAEGGFLCEEFEVTRWLLDVGFKTRLSMSNVGVITPSSGLQAARAERDFLFGLASPRRVVRPIPPRMGELRAALQGGNFDVLHFTGHGTFAEGNADRSSIVLENGTFKPQDITGVVANLGRKKSPIVFLNACEVGKSGMALTGIGGWAKSFLKAEAGVFVAPYWKVLDGSAAAFAQAFYEGLLEPDGTVSRATHAARAAIKQAPDPTWLAYAVFAHPDAAIPQPRP